MKNHDSHNAPRDIDQTEAMDADQAHETTEQANDRLLAELAELDDRWKRALADAQNVRRQSRINEADALYHGQRRALESIIPVLDHFDLALGQDPGAVSAEQIIGGVRLIRDELLKALGAQGVTLVEPNVGDEFDPTRHEAVTRMPAEGVEPGRIVRVLQAGYAMGDRTLRAAKVALAAENAGEDR